MQWAATAHVKFHLGRRTIENGVTDIPFPIKTDATKGAGRHAHTVPPTPTSV